MLPHSKKRRRRKKKTDHHASGAQTITAEALPAPLSITADIPAEPPQATAKPRIGSEFLRKDREVVQALRQRCTENRHQQRSTINAERDRDIEFFVNGLPWPVAVEEPASSDTVGVVMDDVDDDDDDDADIVPAGGGARKTRADDGVDDANTQTTTERHADDDDDVQQLASSFIHIEDCDVVAIRPWTPKKCKNTAADLFVDVNNAIELPDDLSISSIRNVEPDGLFVPDRPSGFSARTESFLCDRLLATGCHLDMVQTINGQRQLVGLRSYEAMAALPRRLRTDGGEKVFRPIFFDSRTHLERSFLFSGGAVGVRNRACSLKMRIGSVYFNKSSDKTNRSLDPNDEERQLCEEIMGLHALHVERQRNAVGEHLEQKILSLRKVLLNCPENSQHYVRYRMELRDVRNQYHRELGEDRQRLRRMLEKWKRVKDVRHLPGYAGDGGQQQLRVVIVTQELDEAADRKRWKRDFDEELRELFEEALLAFEEARQLYRVDRKAGVDGVEPERPNLEAIRDQLHAVFTQTRRHPGEPLVWLEIEAAKARKSVSQRKSKRFVVQMVLDTGLESQVKVADAAGDSVRLDVEFDGVKVMNPSTASCKLVIFEEANSTHSPDRIELYVPLPQPHELYTSATNTDHSFTTKSSISGRISIKIGWTNYLNESPGPATTKPIHLDRNASRAVLSWCEREQIDPMNPDAAALCEAAQRQYKPNRQQRNEHTYRMQSENNDGLFRLNEDLYAFCSKESIAADRRLNALIARHKQNTNLQQHKSAAIAAVSREIPATENADDDGGSEPSPLLEEINWMDPIDVQRHRGRKYLLNVYNSIRDHCERQRLHSAAQDLLIGNDVPTWASFFGTIMRLFRTPSAPLQPLQRANNQCYDAFGMADGIGGSHRRDGKSAVGRDRALNRAAGQCRIVVNVLRAQGIPLRSNADPLDGTDEPPQQQQQRQRQLDMRKISSVSSVLTQSGPHVRPYAVVTLGNVTLRTSTADGSNPTWNEQLIVLPAAAGSANVARDELCVQLFDEVVEDLLDDDRTRANEIYQRISSRWLGEIRVPLFAILSERRIEGTFELTTPALHVGYAKPTIATAGLILPMNVPQMRSGIHVTLFIHCEPTIEMPALNPAFLECTESADVIARVGAWLEGIEADCPHRRFDPLVTLSNGKRVCVTRLVGAIRLPFESGDVTEQLVRRFVSLIPPLRTGHVCTQLNGVWLANDQILTILCASAKDLATMLASYYLQLGYRVHLVVGRMLPHGEGAFVLLKQNGEHYLIDPRTGHKYAANDTRCPLIAAHAIVGPDNVWANVQRERRVFQTRFNVTATADWRALFDKAHPAPAATAESRAIAADESSSSGAVVVSSSGLVHSAAFECGPSFETVELRRFIEWKLMKKINAWRAHRRTVWNRNLGDTLYRILVELEEEEAAFEYENNGKRAAGGHRTDWDRLQHLRSLYRMSGWPMQMAYTSVSAIVERVRATGFHLNGDGRVEFGLTVRLQQYPGNVLSVWVFLLALVPTN